MAKTSIKRAVLILTAAASAVSSTSCGLAERLGIRSEERRSIQRPVVLSVSWWGSEARSDYTTKGLRVYEQSDADVDIRSISTDFTGYKENLDALLAGRQEPDIMMINYSWLPEYSRDGEGFCDLRQFADEIELSNFSESELSYGTVGGKLNALPVSLNAMSFYYNRQMLNSYGLEVPETWDDLFACADLLSQYGIYTLESSDRHYWKLLIAHEEQLTGIPAFGQEGFRTENAASMMYFYKRLIEKKVIPFREYDRSDFIGGKVLGQMLWVSDAQYYTVPLEDKGGEVIVGSYPHMDLNKRFGWYVKPTSLYAISRNTEHPREAAKLLNYMMNDSRMAELQGTEKGVPLSRSALETLEAKNMLMGVPYQASEMIEKSADNFELMPAMLEDIDRVNAFFEYFDLFYYGRMSAEEAADAFVRKFPFS